ncbi:MAG: SH3 domain-containing protein [Phototrophicales bacterium]|nr:SH3 domain-containing protein [Phototrophicales bacterium]
MRPKQVIPIFIIFGLLTIVLFTIQSPSNAQLEPIQAQVTLVTVTPVGTSPLATLTVQPTFDFSLLATPQPALAPGCGTVLPIPIGGTIIVRSGIVIRTAPDPSAPLLRTLIEDFIFTAIEGPVCGGGYVWWRIQEGTFVGWVAERNINIDFFVNYTTTLNPCNPPLTLERFEVITVGYNVRLRDVPSIGGRVVTVAQAGTQAIILSAQPTCADGYNWREIQVEVLGVIYEGWMAEANRQNQVTYLAEATSVFNCLPPITPFLIGDKARVRYADGTPKNLRATPSESGQILFSLLEGVPVDIIGGPVCDGNYVWWQVRVMSTIIAEGWMYEGPRPNGWLQRFDEPVPGYGR